MKWNITHRVYGTDISFDLPRFTGTALVKTEMGPLK